MHILSAAHLEDYAQGEREEGVQKPRNDPTLCSQNIVRKLNNLKTAKADDTAAFDDNVDDDEEHSLGLEHWLSELLGMTKRATKKNRSKHANSVL
jgi:hypothetical protein